jgi:ATP-dependent RNA helicase RhlE
MTSFEDLKLTRQFINAVEELGFTEPTPIQQRAIPPILSGQQVIGIAPTGTGKTAAYLLPLLQLLKYAQGENARALIIVPTKELVFQVRDQIAELAKYTDLRYVGIYGGIGAKSQIEEIRKGVDLIVATPGRFMEIYFKGEIGVKPMKWLVLDEADKMMDMGFMPQLRNLLEVLPRKRQNLLFSATFSPRVEMLSEEFLEFPMKVEVEPQATPVSTVVQVKIPVPNRLTKINLLEHLLQDPDMERVIVFTKTRVAATEIHKYLERSVKGDIRLIHANKGQNFRINSYREFQEGNVRILVATDVAARGIDINDVSHVVNFDVPLIYEDYVHRIGRSGRAGKTGASITFYTPDDEWHILKIEKIIGMEIPVMPMPSEVEKAGYMLYEQKDIAREVDRQKRIDDPTFQGAFHEKKRKNHGNKPVQPKRRRY